MPRRVAVLVPCRNEAATVARVVADFRSALPDCAVYVYDNGSTDDTGELARAAGATVRREERPGKGVVVRRMFGGDRRRRLSARGRRRYLRREKARRSSSRRSLTATSTWSPRCATTDDGKGLTGEDIASATAHSTRCSDAMFGARPTDMLSGYRVFSRRFVKSYPATSRGFEVETELTVHALEQRVPTGELVTPYLPRPKGSTSKLSTWRDGTRILWKAAMLFRGRKAAGFLQRIRLHFRRDRTVARRRGRHRVHGDSTRTAVTDGDSRHRTHAARVPCPRLRAHPQPRRTRTARGKAACLLGDRGSRMSDH